MRILYILLALLCLTQQVFAGVKLEAVYPYNLDKSAAMHYMCGTLIQIVGIHCLQLYACKDLLREAQQRQQDI